MASIEFWTSNASSVWKGKDMKMVRFTLKWRVKHPEKGLLGDDIQGCLFYVHPKTQQYEWKFPANKVGWHAINFHNPTPDLYNLVLAMLREDHEDAVFTRPKVVERLDPAKYPQEVHVELPLASHE